MFCHGCACIDNNKFPFVNYTDVTIDESGKHYIDQEGCGIDRECYLEIHYCPVCGKKL